MNHRLPSGMKRLFGVENPFDGSPILLRRVSHSTMDDAALLVAEGAPAGTVAMARRQRAGRGRLPERRWYAPHDQGLLFTIALALRSLRGPTPLICGLALCELFQERFGLQCQIKWPNDMLVGRAKIAGILCVVRAPWLYIGIGINCNQHRFPSELRQRAISLRQLTGQRISPQSLLPPTLQSLRRALAYDDWHERVLQRLCWVGSRVSFSPADASMGEVVGTLQGITQDGALLIASPSGLQRFEAGVLRRALFDQPPQRLGVET